MDNDLWNFLNDYGEWWPIAVAVLTLLLLFITHRRLRGKMPVKLTPEQKAEALAKRKAQKQAARDKEKVLVCDRITDVLEDLYFKNKISKRRRDYFYSRIAAACGLKELLPKPKPDPSWPWNIKRPKMPPLEILQKRAAALKEAVSTRLAGGIPGPKKPIPGPKPGERIPRKTSGRLATIRARRAQSTGD